LGFVAPDNALSEIDPVYNHRAEIKDVIQYPPGAGRNNDGIHSLALNILLDNVHAVRSAQERMRLTDLYLWRNLSFKSLNVESLSDSATFTNIYA
jgi:hypothetical protein